MATERNPYAPPEARIADVDATAAAPPLWNPNAAANWTLIFTPTFGALLQMKNWQALGESGRATVSRAWAIITLLITMAVSSAPVIWPNKKIAGLQVPISLVLLIVWYLSNGRQQAKYVKQHFASYPRKGWSLPLLLGVLSFAALFVYGLLLVFVLSAIRRSA